ncbi:hypothetical protein [Microbacterium aurum]
MLAGAVMLPVASIAGLPLLIPLTPEPVFAVEATRTPVRAQSFTCRRRVKTDPEATVES